MYNFYQNYQSYVKSYDSEQLDGGDIPIDSLSICSPVETVRDLRPAQQVSINFTPLQPNATANPCGLIAKSYISDTFTLKDSENTVIPINTTNIAWSVDKNQKFKRNANYLVTQWVDVQDERFMNWMEFATTPNWKKLWGRIDADVPPGVYNLMIANTYNVSSFNGSKEFMLSTVTAFGGSSYLLGIMLTSIGSVYLSVTVVLSLFQLIRARKKNVDELSFDWIKKK